jgi:seryl-tRNA synthetase
MIEINDFIVARKGDPEKIRESQKKRNADVGLVDQVIHLFDEHQKIQYAATQIGSNINNIQKQIGQIKKVFEVLFT